LYVSSTKEVDEEEQFGIFVVNADGTKRVEIMRGAYFENTHWSPDGRKILFALGVGEEGQELYTVDADGRNLILLSKGDISGASWSPDGDMIAFMKDHSLYIVNPDSTGKMMLPAVWSYAWNPSGDKIAFSLVVDTKTGKEADFNSSSQNHEASIFMSNPDGTERVQLMRGGYNTIENWSPDGSRLLVRSRDETGYLRNAVIIKLSNVTPVFITPTPKPLENASTIPSAEETPEETDTPATETTAPTTDTVKIPGFTAISSVIGLIVLTLYLSNHKRGA
jgi:Tol biopolymer transport system component